VGDSFQTIADVEAAEAEAPALAASVIGWLAGAGIIAGGPADRGLGTGPGYPAGPRYAAAVTRPGGVLPRLRTKGVEVCTAKTVFYPVQADVGPVACPRCGHSMVLEDPATGEMTAYWERFSYALDNWWAGGPGSVICPQCQRASGLNGWHRTGNWPIAVGFFGLTFWNWPALSQSFVTQVAAHLGHRVVITSGSRFLKFTHWLSTGRTGRAGGVSVRGGLVRE
jgi:hypothetical protein